MLDARPQDTVGFHLGLHLAVEAAIPLAAEKAQDVPGRESQSREPQESLVQAGQRRRTLKRQIRGELGLVDHPPHVVDGEFLAQQGIDSPGIASQDARPIETSEAIGLGLRLGRVVEFKECVVLLHEAQPQTRQLLSEPVEAVHVDLQREGSPGLQANVDESQLRVEEVVIEDALLAGTGDQPRPAFTGNQLK